MAGSYKKPLIVIAGPTASGKSSLAVELCRRIKGEVISADSMQIYNGLDIGTAKPSLQQTGGIPHHLINIRQPWEKYSAADFVKDAEAAIDVILTKEHIPVVCGGTGFYIDSLVNGAEFSEGAADAAVRERLAVELEKLGSAKMYNRLRTLDPVYADSIHENDAKRIIRGLEIIETAGITPTENKSKLISKAGSYDLAYYVLGAEDRSYLYSRIEARVDSMIGEGLVKEAEKVYCNKDSYHTAVQAIGYKELFPYFDGEKSLEECASELKKATRRYAKRQIAWFKRSKTAKHLFIDKMSVLDMVDLIEQDLCHMLGR